MNEIILKNGGDYLKQNTQVYLKVNSVFKKLGFKEVNIDSILKSNQFCNELTLFIYPSTSHEYRREEYITDNLRNEWKKLGGYVDNYIRKTVGIDDEVENILIDDFHIADYYRSRNFVVFFYPIHKLRIEEKNNEFLFYLLDKFSEELQKVKLTKVDVSKKMRIELINKFLEEIKKSVICFQSRIVSRRNSMADYQKSELSCLTEIKQLEEQIKVLKGTYKTMGEKIEEKIEEIRKLPFVTRVGISSKGIRVDFKHIDLEFEGRKIALGECYCYLNPSNLEILNKNYVVFNGSTYHSPHIMNDTICWGSGKDRVHDLLASLKLKELTYFIYIYLKTYNKEDTYINLDNWEMCKEEGGEATSNDEEEDEYTAREGD